mmetsp:Transcript_14706/g.22181  ORF Transcript_14706/g.22181 Transcript_14706/m.22181 type:complete len:468 (-) Transcript_14706:84-1487(-)
MSVLRQLEECVSSYITLSELLLSPSNREELTEPYFHILHAILSLNWLIDTPDLFIGCICHAPRLCDGTTDLAIATQQLNDDTYLISWIYPRNMYEMRSAGMRMDVTVLSRYTEVEHAERVKVLGSSSPGCGVLVRMSTGIYVPGEIGKRMTRGLSRTDETILDVRLESGGVVEVPEDLLWVVPFTKSSPIHNGNLKWDEHGSDEGSDSDESTDAIDVDSLAVEGLRQLQAHGVGLGDWERHTKGIGSRLMSKMGYVRGCGLGKESQGRLQPIEALTVLPQGVSLDFIHETAEERKARSQTLDADGNAVPSKKKNRKRGNEDSTAEHSSQATDVFDFMNNRVGAGAFADRDITTAGQGNPPLFSVRTNEGGGNGRSGPSHSRSKDGGGALGLLSLGEGEKKLKERLVRLKEGLRRNEGTNEGLSNQLREKISSTERELLAIKSSRDNIQTKMNRKKLLLSKNNMKKLF